jgi:hypothetical protein
VSAARIALPPTPSAKTEEERRAAVRAVELDHLPQRPGPVEGTLVDRADGAKERAGGILAAGRRVERVAAHVEVEVEGGVRLPARQGQVHGLIHHALGQARDRFDRAARRGPQAFAVGGAVEHQEHRHGRALSRLIRVPEGQVFG